jgi:hypothetical protein
LRCAAITPVGDVFDAGTFDRPRRPSPARIRVQNQRDHHRRIKRWPTAPIGPVDGIKRVEVHRLDSLEHEPREVVFGQPLAHVRRHQKRLLAITRDEALRHP